MGGKTEVCCFTAVSCQRGIGMPTQLLYCRYLTMAHLFALEDFIVRYTCIQGFSFTARKKDKYIETRTLPSADYAIPLRKNWVMYLKHDLFRWFAALPAELVFCPVQQKTHTRFCRGKGAEGHQGIFHDGLSYLARNTLRPQKYIYKVHHSLL